MSKRNARPKAVRAWALVNTENGAIWATWTFDEKRDAFTPRPKLTGGIKEGWEQWIRVEIRPLRAPAPRRKKEKRK